MKRIFGFLILLVSISVYGQAVTSTPVFPTEDDSITIIFDATQGGQGMMGYNGELYTHTGVITNFSDPSWTNVVGNWGNNNNQPKLTRIGTDLYQLVIGKPRDFYIDVDSMSIDSTAKILRLAFVFRSANASQQTEDLFVDICESGLVVILAQPKVNIRYDDPKRTPVFLKENDTLKVVITRTDCGITTTQITLLVDQAIVAQTFNDTLILDMAWSDYSTGFKNITAVATDTAANSDTSSFLLMVNPPIQNEPLPAGISDGINYINPTTATLSLFAPYKDFIYVIGDFNDWKVDPDYLMKQDVIDADSIHWWITIPNLPQGVEHAFQYFIDDELRIADPYTEKVLDPWNDHFILSSTYPNLKPYPHGKTEFIVSVVQTGQQPFNWIYSDTFQPPPQKDLVIYEMLVRDFIAKHDFQTMIDTLDYFQKLGVNAIELMPVNEFDGNLSWGYNPAFYFAPDKYYGPSEDLKNFIDECHHRGIAVIIDMVLNHSMHLCPLVQLYFDFSSFLPTAENPWFNIVSPNPVYAWGNDFDHESPATKKFVDRVNRFWLTEYKVDGFRFDFTKGFTNKPGDGGAYDASRINILKRMADKIWEVDSTAYVILEHFADNVEEKILTEYGKGMLIWGNTNYNYTEATMGYHSGGQSDFSWGYYRSRGWNKPGLVTYMESHDEERLMYKNITYGNSSGNYSTKDTVTSINRIKMAAAFFFTEPGPKMIWQFQELGYDYSIEYNGRVGEKPIRWDYYNDDEARKKLFKTFAALIKLRNEEDAFTSESANLIFDLSSALKRIRLIHSSLNASIIGNFGVTSASMDPWLAHSGVWYDFFSGDQWFFNSPHDFVPLEPGEFHILTDVQVFTPEQDILNDIEDIPASLPNKFYLAQNYPNPFNPVTSIKYELPISAEINMKIFDITGREIIELQNDYKSAGLHSVNWNGTNKNGNKVGSGVYIYQLTATSGKHETYKQQRKMLLIK